MRRSPVTHRGQAGWCLLLVAVLAGCDTSPSPSPSAATSAPGATAGASTTPASSTGPEATPAAVELPPGAQFARGSTSIPGEAEPVITQFHTRAYFFGSSDGHPEALWKDGADWDRAVIDDGSGYKPPAGSSLDAPFVVVAAANIENAMVVLGSSSTTDRDRPTGFDRLPESVIWTTRDGKTFERIDPRTLVDDAISIRLTDIAVTSAGFVVVGTAFSTGLDGRADVVVLRSADGDTWTVGKRLEGQGTLNARRLFADGDRLVLDGTDQLCDKGGVSYPSGLRTGTTVAWTSPDGGASWDAVNLDAADPVLQQPAALTEGCPANPKLGDLIAVSQELDTQGSIVGLEGGALIARSRDGTMLGVSRDLTTWTQAALPGAVPVAADARRPYAQSIVFEAPGAIRTDQTLALLALQDRPDLEGRPRSGGCQVSWWRSADGGATWSSGPLGRPFSTCAGATWSFRQILDGSVVLFANDIIANTNRGEASFRTGTPGELIPWVTCVPTTEANCAFATINGPAGDANDWPGINLDGATVLGAKLDGLNLHEAQLYAAFLSGSFRGADMGKVRASYVVLEGDFRDVDLRDAFLFHAIIRADLTGANLDGAELTGLTFGDGAVCPDGTAPTVGATDAKAACRV